MFDWIGNIIAWLGSLIGDFAAWLLNIAQSIWNWMIDQLLTALIAVLSAIPVPDFVTAAGGNLAAIPEGVVWFVEPFHIATGIRWIMSAYVLRFLIRRLPFVG